MTKYQHTLRASLLAIIALSGKFTFAQSDSLHATTQDIIIKENRFSIPFKSIAQYVNIITQKQIQQLPARSIQEAMAFTPGVDVRQRGVSGVQANISIRGGSTEQTLILLNGIKMNDPQTGHHIMNVPVPISAVERIDILKGSASRIYGQNAFAGAVNIVTKIPEQAGVFAELFGGDYGMNGGRLYVSAPVKNLKQSFSASRDASKGHWYNSDFAVHNFLYENAYTHKKHTFKGMVGLTKRNFGANGFYTNRFPDQWEQTETWVGAITHQYQTRKFQITNRIYQRTNHDEFRLYRNNPNAFRNVHRTDVFGVESNAALQTKWGKSGLGAEFRSEHINSTNLGIRTRQFVGLFAEQQIDLSKNLELRGGVYANYNSTFGFTLFPGAELGYSLSKNSRVYVNSGRSFRLPSFTELYYQDPSNSSNPNLKPESALNHELGYRYGRNGLRVDAVVFNRYSNNYIDYYREKSDSVVNPNRWTPRNIRTLSTTGFELAASYRFEKSIVKQIGTAYHYTHVDVKALTDVETRLSLTLLKHQYNAYVLVSPIKNTELMLQYRFMERLGLPAYHLLDAKLNVLLKERFTIFTEVSNITNTRYVEAGFVQMPGRWAKAGINYRFWKA